MAIQDHKADTIMEIAQKFTDAFHAHLDQCEQCERNPFDLCMVGAALLRAAGNAASMALGLSVPTWNEDKGIE